MKSGPLTEEEREEFYRILNDPEAFDTVVEKALGGWGRVGLGREPAVRIHRTLFEALG